MCEHKTYYKLPMNIRGLRKMWGETQLDLAIAIDVQPTAICNYESGERIPERDVIVLMAKHYRITENELIHGDFSNMPNLANTKESPIALRRVFLEKFLPFACSLDAMQNSYFSEAFRMHKMLYHKIIREDMSFSMTDVEKCIELYDKAIEDGIIEARANRLWWTIFFGFVINILTVDLIELFEHTDIKKLNIKKVLKSMLPSFTEKNSKEEKELFELKKSFYDENIVDLLVNIRCLKLSQMYADLGDYYLAISYLIGLSPDSISPEMKTSMGLEMLMIFKTIGNYYVRKLFSSDN